MALSTDELRVYVTGISKGGAGNNNFDFATLGYNTANGAELFEERFNGAANSYDAAYRVEVSSDNAMVYVIGRSRSSLTGDDFLLKIYNITAGSNGTKRWDGPGNSTDIPAEMAYNADIKRVYVVGQTKNGTDLDLALLAFDARNGNRIWARTFDYTDIDSPQGLAVSGDGTRIFVTGRTCSVCSDPPVYDLFLSAFNESGSQLWTRSYSGFGGTDGGWGTIVSPSGNHVYVTGDATGNGTSNFDSITLAYESDGDLAWEKRYDYAGKNDVTVAIAISDDGLNLYITGWSHDGGVGINTPFDFVTISYDAQSGYRRWASRFDNGFMRQDQAIALDVSPDGNSVYVTGKSERIVLGLIDFDMRTVAYNATTGAQRWTRAHAGNGGGNDASAAVVATDSRVLVAGTVLNACIQDPTGHYDSGSDNVCEDFAIVAYRSSDGDPEWSRSYNGVAGGNDAICDGVLDENCNIA